MELLMFGSSVGPVSARCRINMLETRQECISYSSTATLTKTNQIRDRSANVQLIRLYSNNETDSIPFSDPTLL